MKVQKEDGTVLEREPVRIVRFLVNCTFETYRKSDLSPSSYSLTRERKMIIKMEDECFDCKKAKQQAIDILQKELPIWKRAGYYLNLKPEAIWLQRVGRVRFAETDAAQVIELEQWKELNQNQNTNEEAS